MILVESKRFCEELDPLVDERDNRNGLQIGQNQVKR